MPYPSSRSLFLGLGLALLLVFGSTGCSGKAPSIDAPALDPSGAASEALALYDANKNGTIEAAELEKSPALKSALAKIDKNNDKQISADELTARMQSWRDSKIAVIPIACTVTLDGAPVSGATVTFVPEKFLGAATPQASGKTDPQGAAVIVSVSPELATKRIAGVYPGLYSVTISGGEPAVPARFGTATTPLGIEVAGDAKSVEEAIVFELSSQ